MFYFWCCQQIELSGFVANELSAFPLPNPEKDIADTELKRRWGMARTEPIESGVEAMPHRIAVTSAISGWARGTSFIFIDTFRFKKGFLYLSGPSAADTTLRP